MRGFRIYRLLAALLALGAPLAGCHPDFGGVDYWDCPAHVIHDAPCSDAENGRTCSGDTGGDCTCNGDRWKCGMRDMSVAGPDLAKPRDMTPSVDQAATDD